MYKIPATQLHFISFCLSSTMLCTINMEIKSTPCKMEYSVYCWNFSLKRYYNTQLDQGNHVFSLDGVVTQHTLFPLCNARLFLPAIGSLLQGELSNARAPQTCMVQVKHWPQLIPLCSSHIFLAVIGIRLQYSLSVKTAQLQVQSSSQRIFNWISTSGKYHGHLDNRYRCHLDHILSLNIHCPTK
jgi:hypothetical protein